MAGRASRVLVALKPTLYAESVARAIEAAGYSVTTESDAGPENHFDAVVTESGEANPASPVTIVVGPDSRAVVHRGDEVGFVTLGGPGDVADVLEVVLTDRPIA